MSRVAEIGPFGGGRGLVAFMCTDCGKTDSVLDHELHMARGADPKRDQNPGRVGERAAANVSDLRHSLPATTEAFRLDAPYPSETVDSFGALLSTRSRYCPHALA